MRIEEFCSTELEIMPSAATDLYIVSQKPLNLWSKLVSDIHIFTLSRKIEYERYIIVWYHSEKLSVFIIIILLVCYVHVEA